jgi:zinc protease
MQGFQLAYLRRGLRKLSRGLLIAMMLLVLLFRLPSAAAEARHYTQLTFPALPEVKVPFYTRWQMSNGLIVYLMEDHELPLVSGTALFYTGDRLEPADKVGLASIVGEVMRTGGTQHHSGDQLNQLLEQQAAAIEAGIGTASGSTSFNALSENFSEVFGLFAEVIQEPVFAQSKLDLAKTQRQGAIARRNDSPDQIAGREFQKLIYGESSPYARTEEYGTLENISRPDLIRFYQQYFHPNRMILGIVGDFDSQTMRSLIQTHFGDWKPGPPLAKISLPRVSQTKHGGIFLVDQPQLTQSYVQVGQLGGQLDNPDVFALYVMNGVLNGLGGKLFNELRSRQGLAYSVYAFWNPEYDYPGLFVAGGQTRSETTVPFVQAIFSEISKLCTTVVTPAELAYAKDSILNSFVFNFQDPAQTLSRLMRYEYYGYPQDFIFRYQRAVKATTAVDVQRAAQTYLRPQDMVTLVVGHAAAIQPPLTAVAATVTPVDVTIPQAKPSSS